MRTRRPNGTATPRVKKIKTGAVVCTLEDLNFPVEIRLEEMPSNKEYSRRVVGQINGGDFLLNQCSDIYELVKNEDIFPNIEQVLNDNKISFTVTYRSINHVRFYADYVITDSRYAYTMRGSKNDTIKPLLRVQHSYNGLTKYRIVFGYFRVICTNGLTIPVQEMSKFNLSITGKHTDSIKHSFVKLDEMLKTFVVEAQQITTTIVNKYDMLGGRMIVNVEDRIKEVLNANKVIIVDNSKFNTLNDIKINVLTEANNDSLGYNGNVNDWLIYNGINQYLNNERNIVVPEKRMETDSKILEYMLEYEYKELAV